MTPDGAERAAVTAGSGARVPISANGTSTQVIDPAVARRVGWLMFVTVFLDMLGFGIVLPLLPLYVKGMGGSPAMAGLLFASFSAMQFIATPILGRLSDRVGRRPIILMSLFGSASSMLVFALASHLALLPLLFASRLVGGATAGNLSACQASIADTTHGSARARGMGMLGAAIGLGIAAGPWIGGALAGYGSWAPPFGAAVFGFADLVLALLLFPETNLHKSGKGEPGGVPRRGRFAELRADPRVTVVALLYFLTFLGMANLQVAFGLLTQLRLGWAEAEVGRAFGVFGLIGLVVQGGLIGRLVAVFGHRTLAIVGPLLNATGMVLVAVGQNFAMIIAGTGLISVGMGIIMPVLSAVASEIAGEERQGTVLGVAQSFGGLARSIGPVISGFLFARISSGAPFFGGAAAALVAVVLSVKYVPQGGREG